MTAPIAVGSCSTRTNQINSKSGVHVDVGLRSLQFAELIPVFGVGTLEP